MESSKFIKLFIAAVMCTKILTGCSTKGTEPFFSQTDIFVSGTQGYHTFRIPSVIVTSKGTILALCEGRKKGRSDTGDIDIVLRRSFDHGKSWEQMMIIWDDNENVCGNPCPVIDRDTGTIWLVLTHNPGVDSESSIEKGTSTGTRTVWVMKSEDDGDTWSLPEEITITAKEPHWRWYATGPGVGIQLSNGRMVIPCDHDLPVTNHILPEINKARRSHIIYSDDHGASWKLGGVLDPYTNECQAVEMVDGTLLLNMRNYSGNNFRAISKSSDGGLTWSKVTYDPVLIEPVCQASLLRYTDERKHDKNRILFSNPASKEKRVNLTVRLSYDECKSWQTSKILYHGPSAYSCLTVLPDGKIGCLFEGGNKGAYEKIMFAIINLSWLTDGSDSFQSSM